MYIGSRNKDYFKDKKKVSVLISLISDMPGNAWLIY